MIYELSIVTKPELGSEAHAEVSAIVKEVLAQTKGELLIQDDWGKYTLAQPFSNGARHGHFHYFMFVAGNTANTEITRRLGINEGVLRHMIIKLANDERNKDSLVKNFKSPFSKAYRGSVLDAKKEDEEEGFEDMEDDRRKFAKRKTCWFTAKKITADWKDPQTWNWLVNEFGKISPARVSGISMKHQRFSNAAIKQARQLGISSYISNRTLDRA